MSWLNRLRATLASALTRRSAVYGMNRRNVELVYPHNPRTLYPTADDKLLAKEILGAAGVPVPPTLASCASMRDLPRVMDILRRTESFVIKPSQGGGGHGIIVVGERCGPDRWVRAGGGTVCIDELHTHLADIVFGAYARGALKDRAMVEPRIVAHPTYATLWPDGLCDVRIITLKARPLMAMVRVPTARSGGKANLHQRGLGLGVDLQTGIVQRAVCEGRPLEVHPDTGTQLVGLTMPLWDQTVDVAVRAAQAVSLGYLGVDIVVDAQSGPLILEINARAGLEIQNVNALGLGAPLAEPRGGAGTNELSPAPFWEGWDATIFEEARTIQ